MGAENQEKSETMHLGTNCKIDEQTDVDQNRQNSLAREQIGKKEDTPPKKKTLKKDRNIENEDFELKLKSSDDKHSVSPTDPKIIINLETITESGKESNIQESFLEDGELENSVD